MIRVIPARIMKPDDDLLTPRELHFVIRYVNHGNAALAAREAGYKPKCSKTHARDMKQRPRIAKKIKELCAERVKDVQPVVQDVLRELAAIVAADPNELIEHRVTCCRHCWSFGTGYKRTKVEMRTARKEHDRAVAAGTWSADFDEQGGDSFDPTEDPDPDCEQCFGVGVSAVVVKDTRTLSPSARALYAGVKQTKNGIEVLTHDKAKALDMMARYLGMLKDVVVTKTDELTDEQLDAKIAEREEAARLAGQFV